MGSLVQQVLASSGHSGLAAVWHWAGQGGGSPPGKSWEGLAQSQETAF